MRKFVVSWNDVDFDLYMEQVLADNASQAVELAITGQITEGQNVGLDGLLAAYERSGYQVLVTEVSR